MLSLESQNLLIITCNLRNSDRQPVFQTAKDPGARNQRPGYVDQLVGQEDSEGEGGARNGSVQTSLPLITRSRSRPIDDVHYGSRRPTMAPYRFKAGQQEH